MGNSSEAVGQITTPGKSRHSKILVDGGNPQETTRIRQLIGFVDGQIGCPAEFVGTQKLKISGES